MDDGQIKVVLAEINIATVMHDQFKKAHDGVIGLIELAQMGALPYGGSVVGPPGCGKNELIRVLSASLPGTGFWGDDKRAMHATAESCPTINDLVQKLLRQLGYPSVIRAGTISQQTRSLIEAIKESRTKVIFLNEFQHIVRGHRTLSAAAITDWIKVLMEEAGVVIFIFGTPELRGLSDLNIQLGSRAPAKFELHPFMVGTLWTGFLAAFAQSVPSFDLSPMYKEFPRKLHLATAGVPRTLKQLLAAAIFSARTSGEAVLTKSMLAAAFVRLFGTDSVHANPFI